MNSAETEVVVIGGGLIGCSVAFYLSKEGVDVILVEGKDLASGTSSACSGGVSLHSKQSGILLRLTRLSIDLYQNLSNELGYDIEYEQHGGLVVAETEAQWSFMNEFVQIQRQAGVKVQLIDGKEANSLQPTLSNEIVGAAYYPESEDGKVNPLYLTFGFAHGAKREGAKIFLNTSVKNIKMASSGVYTVQTNRGEIRTRFVVNTAGVDAPQIGKMLGLEVPITPLRGQLVVTETLPRLFATSSILDGSYIMTKFAPDNQHRVTQDSVPVSFTAHQMQNGNFMFGSTKESVGYNRQTTAEGISAIIKGAVKFFPGLSNLHLIRTFAGLRPHTPDGLPILGRVEDIDGFFMAAGHGGDGVALAPITGRLITELIVEGKTTVDIRKLAFARFSNNEKLC